MPWDLWNWRNYVSSICWKGCPIVDICWWTLSINLARLWYRCWGKNFSALFLNYVHTKSQKIKKSLGQKNSWNQINRFQEIFFRPSSIFCNYKNDQKSIFELEKSLKLPEMQFHEKNYFDLFDFTSFFRLDFFKFSGPLCLTHDIFLTLILYWYST